MNNLKKELPRFLVAGFSAVGTDLAVYYFLLNFLNHSSAKAISFLIGAIVAYVINKYWTFEKKEWLHSEIIKFLTLYIFTLGVNVSINKFSLSIFDGLVLNYVFFAFLTATTASTVLNFIGQKRWVFARKQEHEFK